MGVIIDIRNRIKSRFARDPEETTRNPIVDLYNTALTHPVTTVGLLAGAIGIGAALAFVLAEQRAEKGIAQEMLREGLRARKRLTDWTQEEIAPRVKNYRRKYKKRLRRLKR